MGREKFIEECEDCGQEAHDCICEDCQECGFTGGLCEYCEMLCYECCPGHDTCDNCQSKGELCEECDISDQQLLCYKCCPGHDD